ncbi:MAG TPA: PAS domain-containing protein [Anaerolineaceae bacterium]|nr:PAS domain-containing protein [Anaerolineaceae bacterium]
MKTKSLSTRTRWLILGVVTATYVVAFFTLQPLWGLKTAALSLIPISTAALFFGGLAGLISGVLAVSLNTLFIRILGIPTWQTIWLPDGSADALALITIGIGLGWLSDLRRHYIREVEERQRTEYVRQVGEEKLSSILAGMNEVVYSISVPGLKLLNINPAAERLFGRPLKEIVQNSRLMSEAVYPDDRPLVENSLAEVLEKKECEWEYRIFQPNGEVRWVLDRTKLITQRNNHPVRIDHLVNDITAKKLAEQELIKTKNELELRVIERTAELQSANKELQIQLSERIKAEEVAKDRAAETEEGKRILDAIMKFIPEGIAIADMPDGKVRMISQHGLETLQLANEYLETISFLEHPNLIQIYHLDGKTEALPEEMPLYRAAVEGEVILNEQWLLRLDEDHYKFILCNAAPIRKSATNQINGAIMAWRDITDRKKALDEVREKADTIEAQHYLLQGREMERLRTARTLHDNLLQNMLTIAFAFDEANRMAKEKTLKEIMNAIRTTLQDQIENLRDFCGAVRPPILVHFGVEKGIRSHVEKFQATYPEIKIHLQLGKDGLILPEDIRLTIFRIYIELMTNVAKHASASAVYVRFGINQDCAELEIADNGSGFDVPDNWIDLVRHGHLGLAGVRERVEALNGSMNIRSSSAGTIVNVSLPMLNQN